MTLHLPSGHWVGHVSMQAGPLGACGSGHPDAGKSMDGDYDCWLAVAGGGGGHPASSRIGEFRTSAWSIDFWSPGQATAVTVQCRLFDSAPDRGATLSVGSFVAVPVVGRVHQ